ncbi:MAG: hypothetical protein LBL86_00490 [Coriobacteriales bacterium]|nr:hypothetical protein [Coriobacteriales bacterium]
MPGVVGSRPAPPLRADIPKVLDERLVRLYDGVRDALLELPSCFSFSHTISGIKTTGLFDLNSQVGAAIENQVEDQVVTTLNATRTVWDGSNEWEDCSFVRAPQAFPNVRLVREAADAKAETVLGIELKGWYVLSKEGVPSLRYHVGQAACAAQDLVCVIPWYLDNAICGEARVMTPWVEQARYAAEWRDYWWQHLRKGTDTREERAIRQPDGAAPYPSKAELAIARPVKDGGGNFGRLPRCKPLMDEFTAATLEQEILGIPARDWVDLPLTHADGADPKTVAAALRSRLDTAKKLLEEREAAEMFGLLKLLMGRSGLSGLGG